MNDSTTKIKPLDRFAFALGVLGLSWIGMMAVHELGHVVGAICTGGTVQRVVLPVFGFSRTDVGPNPSPGIVVWAGPIVGVLLPAAVWLTAHRLGLTRIEKALRFFAGFCLIANGAYLSLGIFDRIGDVDVILKTGTPTWGLWIFGGVSIPLGFLLWHGLGERFGLSRLKTRWVAWLMFSLFVALCFFAIDIQLID